MKAMVQDGYGPPEQLKLQEIETPSPGRGEVLVRVKAASVNARDWHYLRGDPLLARLGSPALSLSAPKRKVRGSDVSGVVEAVGEGVSSVEPGDEIFGDLREGDGAFAEFVCAPQELVSRKPSTLSFEQAAAVPLAAATALAGLRRTANVQKGQSVLINGASGGVGTFAVQIAKLLGATVTAVCSTRNADLLRSLGADRVVDYTREDFSSGPRHDLVFDLVGNRRLADLKRVLAPGGMILLSGGGTSGNGRINALGPMRLMLGAQLFGRFHRADIRVLSDVPPGRDLAALRELCESGKVVPVIERSYPLSEVPRAIGHLEREHARAKVVITVATESAAG